jgi:hypothetical protein
MRNFSWRSQHAMADEKETLDPQPRRRVPPPTIDLEATPVSGPDDSASAAAAPSDPPPSDPPPGDASEKTSSGSSPEQSSVPRRRPGIGHVLSGAVGAALALGVAAIAWTQFGAGPDHSAADAVDAVNARLARIESDLAARPKSLPQSLPPAPPSIDPKALDELTRRLGQIESALANPATPVSDAALAARLAAVEDGLKDVKPLAGATADLNRRLDETANAARAARERADAAAAAVAAAPRPSPPVDTSRFVARTDLDALAARIASLDAAVKSLGDRLAKIASMSADASAGSARDAIAALVLRLAVERGAPYASELAAIDPALAGKPALDALAPFAQSGVPTAAALSRDLAALLPAARKAAEPPEHDGSLLDRLHVRVRPIGEPTGDAPDAALARLDTAAARADLAAARADIAKLPPPARAPLEPWMQRVAARDAALAAATALVTRGLDAARRPSTEAVPAR